MGGKKPLRRPLWPPTRATASNYYPLGLDGAGGAAKPLLRAPKKPAPLHGRLPAFSGAVDAFERARKCFLEWRYFFSIILSEFLKNRVALQVSKGDSHGGVIKGVCGAYKGATFTIEDGETLTFGRDPAICHVVFETSNISRAHCTIRYSAAENSYYVKDTSRNGTYYADGIRMQPQREMPVTAGEKIYLDNPNEMFRLG